MANSSILNIYPSDPTNYSAKITKYTLYYYTYIVLYDVTSEQKSKMSAYLPEYDRYIPLCESTGDTAKFIIFDPLDDNVAFPYNEWTELMENGVTSFIIHIICDEDTTLVYKLEKVDAINDANKTFMIEEDYFQVDYLGETNGEESDDSGGDNGEGSDSMAVYGFGENKCKVEVLSRANIIDVVFPYFLGSDLDDTTPSDPYIIYLNSNNFPKGSHISNMILIGARMIDEDEMCDRIDLMIGAADAGYGITSSISYDQEENSIYFYAHSTKMLESHEVFVQLFFLRLPQN